MIECGVETKELVGRSTLAWIILGGTLVSVLYLDLITHSTFRLLAAGDGFGLTFNSMLAHLLVGQFDVDPSAIAEEAYFRDGHTYTHFGVFPALLRFPLLLTGDLETAHVERLSCWVAMLVGAGAHAAAILAVVGTIIDTTVRRVLTFTLLVIAFASGPPLLLGNRAHIYNEVVFWSWAQGMLFVAFATHGLFRAKAFSTKLLTAMSIVAGLCLLTRVTTGFGLYVALFLLMLGTAIQPVGNSSTSGHKLSTRFVSLHLLLPLAVLAAFALIAGVINIGRWGVPWRFADLQEQSQILAAFPDRIGRLERYGSFDIRRLGIGILYYFLPLWNDSLDAILPLGPRIKDLFDGLEAPPSSLFVTDPLTMALSIYALFMFFRKRVSGLPGSLGPLLLAGLLLPGFLMLIAWYMAFRYRAEFAPALVLASCCGAASLSQRLQRAPAVSRNVSMVIVTFLCILQVISASVSGRIEGAAQAGPTVGYEGVSMPLYFQHLSGRS